MPIDLRGLLRNVRMLAGGRRFGQYLTDPTAMWSSLALACWRHVAAALLGVLVATYLWFQLRFSHWRRKGVPGPPPSFPAGNIGGVFLKRQQFFEPFIECYEMYKNLPYVGLYTLYNPVLVVNDAGLIRKMLVKDFEHFAMHGTTACAEIDPLSMHLFNLHGERWKKMRNLITPTFSSAKMKLLFHNLVTAGAEMQRHLDAAAEEGRVEDLSKVFSNYSLDVIGRVAFGVECNCFTDPNSIYKKNVHEFLEPSSFYWQVVRTIWFLTPELFRRLRLTRIKPAVTRFFVSLVQGTVRHRQQTGEQRSDFLQMLIDIQSHDRDGEKSMDWGQMAGNAMMYLAAGYETSSTTATFAVYELSRSPDALRKAKDEVKAVLDKYGGQITYESLAEMTYLSLVVEETLRKHPPMRALFRRCTMDYQIPGTDTWIERGTWVFIPIQGLQNDADIFPEPDLFRPERFLPQNKTEKQNAVYMPFGEGPKMCLGIRFGIMSTKMALASFLRRYEFRLDRRTPVPVRYKTTSLPLAIDPGLFVTMSRS